MRVILTLVSMVAAATLSLAARADAGFAALVSPPRFEVKGKPGATVREVFELSNRSGGACEVQDTHGRLHAQPRLQRDLPR